MSSGSAGVAQPQPAAARSALPPQFTEVAEVDWTANKPLVGRELKCGNGKVRIFTCREVDLFAFLPISVIGGGELSDIWGWTDAATGREFALVGRAAGTSFIEITDPVNPRYLGELPLHQGARPSSWRDIKVYKHHAFIVSDAAGPHGMQVFDLTQLREAQGAPAVFRETAHYDQISSAHNVVIDSATGFAYIVGSSGRGETCGGGLHMVDIRTPTTPTFVGCYAETLGGDRERGYIHDAQCLSYQGPDQQYRGREICLNAAEKALGIVDVTDKQQPKLISVGKYPNVGYTHQGWFTEDHRYFFVGDEADEGQGRTTRTIVFDLNDLDDPVVVQEFFGTTTANDHNLYVRDHYVYQSHYAAGLRILDITDPRAPKEVAYFDTAPKYDGPGFHGSWSNYPYFKSGLIAVSSIEQGVYILRHRPAGTTR